MQLARLVAIVLVTFILLGVIQIVISRSWVFAFLVRFAGIGFIAVRLVLVGPRLLMVLFPVSGVDGMHESLHGFKSQGFALLAHDIFDSFHQTRVVSVSEDTVVPAGLNREMVELNIVLDDMLIVLHLQVVNLVFSISSQIDQTKLGMESLDEGGPIVHPSQGLVRVQDCWLEVL